MRKYDAGVGALKFLMANLVVWMHFGHCLPGQTLAVLVFAFYSFFYVGCTYDLRKRVVRILWPFWWWGAFSVLFCVFALGEPFELRRVGLQFLFGHAYCTPLWFLFSLGACSCLIWPLRFCGPKARVLILSLMSILSLLWIWSGLNHKSFGWMPSELQYPLGRTFELLPTCLIGCLAGLARAAGRLTNRLALAGGTLLAILGVIAYPVFPRIPGFLYSDVWLFPMCVGLCIVFWGVGNLRFAAGEMGFVRKIADTSSCIYYIHSFVGPCAVFLAGGRSFVSGILASIIALGCSLVLQRFSVFDRITR